MWKSKLSKPSTKTIPSLRTNLRKVPVKPQENNCNEQLKNMANKLSSYKLLLEERWEAGWPAFQEYYRIIPAGDASNVFALTLKDEYSRSSWENWDLFETKKYLFNPIPEEIACKALDILKNHEQTSMEYDTGKSYKFKDWNIERNLNWDYQHNINSLKIIDPQGNTQIHLSWGNGEDTRLIRKPGSSDTVDTTFGGYNIYKISGYYDARKFGCSWHE
jgi:hypothetical protein